MLLGRFVPGEPAVVVFYFVFYISVDCRFYWIRNNFLILCYVLPKKKNGKEESYDPIIPGDPTG